MRLSCTQAVRSEVGMLRREEDVSLPLASDRKPFNHLSKQRCLRGTSNSLRLKIFLGGLTN